MSRPGRWWVILLPGEDADEAYGPFRSHDRALAVADKWNHNADPGDMADVVPIRSAHLIGGHR